MHAGGEAQQERPPERARSRPFATAGVLQSRRRLHEQGGVDGLDGLQIGGEPHDRAEAQLLGPHRPAPVGIGDRRQQCRLRRFIGRVDADPDPVRRLGRPSRPRRGQHRRGDAVPAHQRLGPRGEGLGLGRVRGRLRLGQQGADACQHPLVRRVRRVGARGGGAGQRRQVLQLRQPDQEAQQRPQGRTEARPRSEHGRTDRLVARRCPQFSQLRLPPRVERAGRVGRQLGAHHGTQQVDGHAIGPPRVQPEELGRLPAPRPRLLDRGQQVPGHLVFVELLACRRPHRPPPRDAVVAPPGPSSRREQPGGTAAPARRRRPALWTTGRAASRVDDGGGVIVNEREVP